MWWRLLRSEHVYAVFSAKKKIKSYSSETTSGCMTQLFCAFRSFINTLDVCGPGWHCGRRIILWWMFWGEAWESFKWIWGELQPKNSPVLKKKKQKKKTCSDRLQMKALTNTWVCWGLSWELGAPTGAVLTVYHSWEPANTRCRAVITPWVTNTALEGMKNGKPCDNSSPKCL